MIGRIASWVSSCIVLVSCAAPSGDAPDAKPTLATVEGYCAARAESECAAIVVTKCGSKDQTACEKARAASCLAEIPQGTTYVPDGAASCVAKTRDAYSDGQLTAAEVAAVQAACARVFSGPGGVRAPCTVDADCSSAMNLSCVVRPDPHGAAPTGKCLTPREVAPGESCAGEADVCTADFFCNPMSKQCDARAGGGDSCSPEYKPCVAGYKCPTSIFGGACTALAQAGEPCTSDPQCAHALCSKAKGAQEGTCADVIALSPLSAACAPFQ